MYAVVVVVVVMLFLLVTSFVLIISYSKLDSCDKNNLITRDALKR